MRCPFVVCDRAAVWEGPWSACQARSFWNSSPVMRMPAAAMHLQPVMPRSWRSPTNQQHYQNSPITVTIRNHSARRTALADTTASCLPCRPTTQATRRIGRQGNEDRREGRLTPGRPVIGRALERAEGIEPSSVAWKATALPLCYARIAPAPLSAFGSARASPVPPGSPGARHIGPLTSAAAHPLYAPCAGFTGRCCSGDFLGASSQGVGVAGV